MALMFLSWLPFAVAFCRCLTSWCMGFCRTLALMGFSSEAGSAALRATGGDMEAAVEYMLGGGGARP